MAHNFNHQTNITLGESIKMGVKAPALEDRIFDTWSDANIYIHDENSSAVNGLVLTVINDGENNGGWFVDKVETGNNQYELTLTRIGMGGGGSCDLLIPITYNALKNFRDTNQLVPGCRYRIIDYVTKANVDMFNMDWSGISPSQLQYLSFSAEHPYDIIVLATAVNKLSEDAKAIQHEGDTYFSGSNLEAWELKYSLDNDTQYSWIQDPFNYGESILPPFPFCYISTKADGQYPDFQNLQWQDNYSYHDYNLCNEVPDWLEQQIAQFVAIYEQYGMEISIEIGDTYYVPYPDYPVYGMVRISCWGLEDQVVYFNRITVLRITIEGHLIEFPVVYDYENANVWHLEGEGIEMDLGVTFGTEWEIMGKKGEWNKVGVKNTGKIIVEVHGCKGVVFEMKDEFNNKADYDFKNIVYATDYDTDGVYSFDLYIDTNNIPINIVIPDSIDNPTQVVDSYSNTYVNCTYDDWLYWFIPYYNEQQCFISYNGYLFRYLYYESYGDYVGYNDNGTIDTSVICPEEILKTLAEYVSKYASITQYFLELYLDYTFSKGWHDYSLGDDDDNNKKGTDDVSLEKGGKREKTKHIYKNLFSNIPVKEYKTVDGGKIKTYLEGVSEKRDGKKRDGDPKNRLSVLNRIEDIRKASVGDKKFTFEGNLKSVLVNSRKSANVRADSSSSPVVAYVTEDASLNIYDMESYEGYKPIVVAENEVHGYVVNYAESQEESDQIGCRTLPMIVLYAYPSSDFNYQSSITFNKVASEGYYGVTYIECYWFEGNKLFFPDFYDNYIDALSFNAIYNYWDEVGYEIWGYPGSYGDEYWQQGDYRALNHRPDAIITFEDSDGNELGSFNIGDDQQDDETIVIPTGGGMPTMQWRTPTKDEWSFLLHYRSASKIYDSTLGDYVANARYIHAQISSINGLMLLPDVFELPSGITMNNINVNSSQYIENIYTVSQWEELEGAGCIFLPCGGYRWVTTINDLNRVGYYWTSSNGGPSEIYDAWGAILDAYPSLIYNPLENGNSVRLIKDEQTGNFTISERDNKCSIAKSNLQFHCKNKEWRFAENAYDIIGSDNANIAENYDGWIDLFGYGTSGWNSGFNAYQPWSTSIDYIDYISYDLTGEYANADWGIYNMSYDSLATVAFTGNYNDLENKPTIPAAQIQSDWAQTDNTAVDYIKNKPTLEPFVINRIGSGTNPYQSETDRTAEQIYNAVQDGRLIKYAYMSYSWILSPVICEKSTNNTYKIVFVSVDLRSDTTVSTNSTYISDSVAFFSNASSFHADWVAADNVYLSMRSGVNTINNGKLKLQRNGVLITEFTANGSSDITANITVPTQLTDLTNNIDWYGTQAEFEALQSYSETTNYHIETNPSTALPFKTYDKLIKYIAPEPFYVMPLDNNGGVTVTRNSGASEINLQYSLDKTTWESLTIAEGETHSFVSAANQKIYFKGIVNGNALNALNGWKIRATTNYNIGGHLVSILRTDWASVNQINGEGNNRFKSFFANDTNLIDAGALIMPTNAIASCYREMFKGCTNLTTAPDLPAATLMNFSYEDMFRDCSSLTSIKCLATNINAGGGATNNMTNGVAANGTFYKAANMNDWTTGANGIPSGWSVVDV